MFCASLAGACRKFLLHLFNELGSLNGCSYSAIKCVLSQELADVWEYITAWWISNPQGHWVYSVWTIRKPLSILRPQFDSWVGKIPWRRDRLHTPVFLGFSGGSDSKESASNEGFQPWVQPQGWEDPLEEGMATHSRILARRIPNGQRSLVGYSPWGHKESDMTERLSTAHRSKL